MNNKRQQSSDELFEIIASLKDANQVKEFMTDLCSSGEITAFSQRLEAAKLLMEGKTYEQVISATDISSTTLSRVSKCVKNGEGYKKVLPLILNKE